LMMTETVIGADSWILRSSGRRAGGRWVAPGS
jgi:hypothetical protein